MNPIFKNLVHYHHRDPFSILDMLRPNFFSVDPQLSKLVYCLMLKHYLKHIIGYSIFELYIVNYEEARDGRSIEFISDWIENQFWQKYNEEFFACTNMLFLIESKKIFAQALLFYKHNNFKSFKRDLKPGFEERLSV